MKPEEKTELSKSVIKERTKRQELLTMEPTRLLVDDRRYLAARQEREARETGDPHGVGTLQ